MRRPRKHEAIHGAPAQAPAAPMSSEMATAAPIQSTVVDIATTATAMVKMSRKVDFV